MGSPSPFDMGVAALRRAGEWLAPFEIGDGLVAGARTAGSRRTETGVLAALREQERLVRLDRGRCIASALSARRSRASVETPERGRSEVREVPGQGSVGIRRHRGQRQRAPAYDPSTSTKPQVSGVCKLWIQRVRRAGAAMVNRSGHRRGVPPAGPRLAMDLAAVGGHLD